MCAEAGETYRAAKCSSSFLMFFAIGSSTGGSTSGWAQACVVMRATRVLCLNNARQAINFTTAPTTARSAPRRFRIYVYIYIIVDLAVRLIHLTAPRRFRMHVYIHGI
jgi:hypothetical protein